jgi:RNA polymerase sigma factor (TIGR02999 family)
LLGKLVRQRFSLMLVNHNGYNEDMGDITELIHASNRGDHGAMNRLFQALYDELHQLARSRMQSNGAVTYLDTTSLLHESYMSLVKAGNLQLNDRKHFFAYAATSMRHIVVDFVRERRSEKRGGGVQPITLNTTVAESSLNGGDDVMRVHEALEVLALHDERLVKVVELRYFGGLSEAEVADVLGINERTVRRDWRKAKLLLATVLSDE